MPATVLLLGLVLVAATTDLLRHKIYNWTTYPGIVAAMVLNAAGLGVNLAERGRVDLWQGVVGFLACGFLMLVCYVLFKVGGGDVKLIAMLGAFLGPEGGIKAMLWTFVLGGCLGLIVLIWRMGPVRITTRAFRQITHTLRLRRWSPLTVEEREQLQPPLFLAPCALAAVVIVRFGLV